MKIKFKTTKTVEDEIEIEIPIPSFYKTYTEAIAILTEEKAISVCIIPSMNYTIIKDTVVTDFNFSDKERSNREEFFKQFNKALEIINESIIEGTDWRELYAEKIKIEDQIKAEQEEFTL